MIRVTVETPIHATPERCFDLARDLNIHTQTTGGSKEKVIEGPASGMMELGDVVTFEAVHFGIRQRLTARIVEYERPLFFVDAMEKGAFRSLRHEHRFEEAASGTMMVDDVILEAPFGPMGWVAERLFLSEYMRRFLAGRGRELKQIAEGD